MYPEKYENRLAAQELPFNKLTPSEKKLLEWGKRKDEIRGGYGLLLEGVKLIEEGIRCGLRFQAVWFTENASIDDDLRSSILQACPSGRQVGNRLMTTMSDMEAPPGILAVTEQPRIVFKTPTERFRLIVALFGAQDPGNVGGVIRTADYFAADEVWLDQLSADPYSPKGVRGSMGAVLRMPIFRGDLAGRIAEFAGKGAEVWAAVAHGEAARLFPAGRRRILMIGNESKGLSEEEVSLASKLIRIPGSGKTESLNLGVATGILVYLATRSD